MTFDDLVWFAHEWRPDGDSMGEWLITGDAEDVVAYYENGAEIDRLVEILRVLVTVTDDELREATQQRLNEMIFARGRYAGDVYPTGV